MDLAGRPTADSRIRAGSARGPAIIRCGASTGIGLQAHDESSLLSRHLKAGVP
jgi:hypothetical protein